MAINLTESAFTYLMSLRPSDTSALRVKVLGGGCSGLQYGMDWVDASSVTETDKLFKVDDLKLVVDGKSYIYLHGCTLDHQGGLNGKGFVWENPSATHSCGCGQSFNT